MKAILTAAAAAFVVAGAFAQVQTGEPSNGSKLGVTPPPSTSVTTDTSRLSTDCSTVADKQRSHQAGGTQVGTADCAKGTNTMGATAATTTTTAAPATTGTTQYSSSTTNSSSSNTAAMSSDTTSKTDVAMDDTASAKKSKKVRKARADRG